MNDDVRLVNATLAGDTNAFGELVERYEQRLFNSLCRIVCSREDACDLAQDAFVQAFSKLSSFRGDSQFYTWLYRIAMNLALSHRRRRKAMTSVDDVKDRIGAEPTDPAAGPESRMLSQERVAEVQSALASLAPKHRHILVLREIEQFSYETISEILNLPIGTVRSRIFRARLQLKDKLQLAWSEDSRQIG